MNRNEMIMEARAILDELIKKFPEWWNKLIQIKFRVNYKLRTTSGRAFKLYGTIDLNPHIFILERNRQNFKNTVLHEIAHILCNKRGHGSGWKAICKVIGCNAQRLHNMSGVQISYMRSAAVYSI